MKSSVILLMLFFLASCGSIKVNPKSCRSEAEWGSSGASSRQMTRERLDEEKVLDLKANETFLVFFDRDIRIRDLLEENGLKCENVKKLRVQIETTWFFWRKVSLKVVKN